MADREKVRALAQKHLAAGDPAGWFEPLYASAHASAAGAAGEIPWADLKPNPNLVVWLDRELGSQSISPTGRALTIGCGLGDDAEELARRGWAVTAFDISPTAIAWCHERFPQTPVDYRIANLLDPPAEWVGRFDFVFESYTVQALPHDVRTKALTNVAGFVASGGNLLLICRGRDASDPPGDLPWPLLRSELDSLVGKSGLTETSFEDFFDAEDLFARRFRCTYHRG